MSCSRLGSRIAWCACAVLIGMEARSALAQGGPFRFTNVTASSRFISLRNSGGHGVQWADATGDGRPDVYVTHIFDPSENRPDLFFVNQGGGTFNERGVRAGVHVVKEERHRHFEDFRDMVQAAGADPVGAAFILLNLLKCQAKLFTKLFLA